MTARYSSFYHTWSSYFYPVMAKQQSWCRVKFLTPGEVLENTGRKKTFVFLQHTFCSMEFENRALSCWSLHKHRREWLLLNELQKEKMQSYSVGEDNKTEVLWNRIVKKYSAHSKNLLICRWNILNAYFLMCAFKLKY